MGFLDILAGGLSGANQGFGAVQDQRQLQFKNKQAEIAAQLEQRRAQLQEDQARREAVQAARSQLKGGMKVDPAQLPEFAKYGLQAGIEKSDDGSFTVAMSPQEQLIANQLAKYEEEHADKKRQDAVLDQIHNEGSGWFQRPLQERYAAAVGVGLKPDLAFSPDEALQYNPQVTVGRASAAARLGSANGPLQQQTLQLKQQEFAQKQDADAVKYAQNMAKDVTGQIDPQKYQLFYQQYKAQLGQPGVQPQASTSSAPPSTGRAITPGTKRIVKGIPATWDGHGWVPD